MSNQGVGPAFIDLATYGELESYLYGNRIKIQEPTSPPMKHKKIIGVIMVMIILYYLKKK